MKKMLLSFTQIIIIILIANSLTFAQAFTQLGIDIDAEAAGDVSGRAVSLSSDGTRVAIGAYLNNGDGTARGHVRVYSESGGTWTQVGSDIDGVADNDESGFAVSLASDGSRVAIGAPVSNSNTGHVRVYSESGGTWTQVGSDIDGEAAGDESGRSVSLSSDGSRIAIGAPYNGGTDAGHVRIYNWTGSAWEQVGAAIVGAGWDRSGWSVSLSSDGSKVAIGAPDEDTQTGAVRVYSESSGTWSQIGSDIDGEAAFDELGYAVSLSSDGTRVAIGAPNNNGSGSGRGHVRIYDWSGTNWIHAGSDIDGEADNDESGRAVSLSSDGTRVAIGARSNDGIGTDRGHVRIYDWNGTTWIQAGIDIDGEADNDESGRAVSLSSSGTKLAIGAPYNGGTGLDAGHVRVYFESPPGSGAIGDPYLISNLDELEWVSKSSSSWGDYFEQTADIDATATSTWDPNTSTFHGFSPIGNSGTNFEGSYDGQGHTIDGLFIYRPGTDYIGLFGNVWTATIENLGVINVNITGGGKVGGLVGGHTSTVINCYSTGNVTGGVVVTDLEVGGLVGVNYLGAVSNSYSTANVQGLGRVGGLVGANFNTTTVSNCYSRGAVTRSSGTGPNFGAFCGYNNDSTIEYCYSTGSVYYGDPDIEPDNPADPDDPTDKGFVGWDNSSAPGTFTNNFWSSEISNQATAIGATDITETQMRSLYTFTHTATVGLDNPWDFETDPFEDSASEDYWDMDKSGSGKLRTSLSENNGMGKVISVAGVPYNDGYPFLSWENGDDIALPVELSLFTAEATNQGVLCEWTTESEIENLGFILERKTEGTGWTEIASYKTDEGLLGQGSISSATDYEYLDVLVEPNTTYEYRLGDVDYDGIITYHATREVTVDQAPLSSQIERFTVLPAYPNPFNPSTTITYGLETDSKITVQIYDITGQLITTLLKTEQTQGWHSVVWNGTNNKGTLAPAGIYLSKITSGNEVKTAKLMLLK